ncbi:MFS transporter, NNP family, nitrate/nitrite transporter [Pseudomonas peli]|uniref:MFS transporter, NNP family, nitrate/nitrite transporter n=1 Tax=Pseudomonas peli TaxID=592361 RepID=A0AB37ZA22_9PSED|nr:MULTISPECIES: nitrate/nitrite transporter [Pseudomonas]MCZ4323112.1 NarK/NasA family nitrate transporter [Pseudomonas anguilliseptica]NMZ70637.1 NarK/NasA family nitrate transporter [Pseudomonas peli]PJE40590.1 MAG: NarK/NasA family nitrate transporter [Pseudomonas sp.] [Pseudomonas sp. FEMGT703P]SCW71390.1 MFS transporter, NNP family, nitrate/nitrite transporter [Pseudomonas peli]|tara:strand:- start:20159 stop:21427 length:1269 start_codon:yes stop_codon:yes gene_type:complete
MVSQKVQQGLVLGMSTTAFTICFMVWMMFAVLGIPVKELLQLNETQFGLLVSTPVLTGSLVRLPLGMLTDRFGGRIVFLLLMLACVLPIYLISAATQYWQFLVLGLFVGLAGGSFSVGIAYVAKWFSKQTQGTAMGVFGAGNAGAALTKFVAPAIIAASSWQMVPKVYSAIMFITAVLFWFFTYENKKHRMPSSVSFAEQLKTLKDPRVWRYCQYYSIVFGGYVALALWMTKYYVQEYEFSLQSAALLAACFSLPGGLLRAIGGWMSDKWSAHSVTWWVMWVSWICLFILSYPQTSLIVQTVDGPQSFHLGLNATVFTVLLFVMGIAFAFGKASVFKYISDEFPDRMGAVSGIVGLAGGLGGFVLPIMFGALVDLTGVRSSCFMLMYGVVWVSLIWMYFSEVRSTPVMGHGSSSPMASASDA